MTDPDALRPWQAALTFPVADDFVATGNQQETYAKSYTDCSRLTPQFQDLAQPAPRPGKRPPQSPTIKASAGTRQ